MKRIIEWIDGYLFQMGASDPLTEDQIQRIEAIIAENL